VRLRFAFPRFSPGTDTSFPQVKPHRGVLTRAARILKNLEKNDFDLTLAGSQLDDRFQSDVGS